VYGRCGLTSTIRTVAVNGPRPKQQGTAVLGDRVRVMCDIVPVSLPGRSMLCVCQSCNTQQFSTSLLCLSFERIHVQHLPVFPDLGWRDQSCRINVGVRK
jgi:hypothetical protein